jgi:hypothetical protein
MEGSGDWPPDGLELHVLFGSEGSLRVSEIWDTEEQSRSFGERLFPVLSEVGVEADPPELLESTRFRSARRAVAYRPPRS